MVGVASGPEEPGLTDLSEALAVRPNRRPCKLLPAGFAALLIAACVSPPRPAGPTTLAGRLPPLTAGASGDAAPAPGASEGPLRLRDPAFRWRHAGEASARYAWECTLENPSHTTFLVTLVVGLWDADGRLLVSNSESLLLEARSHRRASGEGSVDAATAAQATEWRIEYWVRVPSPPDPAPDAGRDPDAVRRATLRTAHSHSMVEGGLVEMS